MFEKKVLFCLSLLLMKFNKIALTKVIAEIWEQGDVSRKTSGGAKKQALKAIRTIDWFHQYFISVLAGLNNGVINFASYTSCFKLQQ